jgi:aldose sugar dehydrogenase
VVDEPSLYGWDFSASSYLNFLVFGECMLRQTLSLGVRELCVSIFRAGLMTGLCASGLVSMAQAANVEDLYKGFCASCHGDKMQGGMGPSLVDEQWLHGSSNEDIARVIKNGVATGGMPAFGKSFSDQQIRALVILLREASYGPPPESVSVSADTVFNSGAHSFSLQKVVDLPGTIWSMAFLTQDTLLATQLEGQLWLVEKGKVVGPVQGIPKVWVKSQAGMLEVAAHPKYAQNGWIYLAFSDPAEKVSMTRVVRGKIRDGKWVEQQDIFVIPKSFYSDKPWHFGSRMAFIGDDLYFTIGERTAPALAQDVKFPNGKIYRVKDDGSIPKDNPFAAQKDAFPGVWTYGHRNPQGIAVDPSTGDLWASEHGPRGGDEINLIEKGLNYGWPVITYGMDYDGTPWSDTVKTHQEGMEQPKHYWVPSIAVSDIDFYTGQQFPQWHNKLLVASMAKQQLHLLTIKDRKVVADEILLKNLGRIRDVADGPDGYPYMVLNVNEASAIYRLVPAVSTAVAAPTSSTVPKK